jgi:hypothetical protein
LKTRSHSNISILLIALVFLTSASIAIGNTNNVSVYGEQYGYNDNYPTKEINKYECQTGPFEGFFTSSPEFCKSKVIPDRDRDGGSTPPSNPDTDGDGVNDNVDNCPTTSNPEQVDRPDNDGIGNLCDPDDDNDGINDNVDNCPEIANTNQTDTDNDGIGNVCDSTPNTPNPDTDGDGVNDNVDNCPTTSNPDQADQDGDRIGNVCDPDDDNDGINDNDDNCPLVANTNQTDTDNDGIGDACDPDTTNPGVQPLVFYDLGYETGDIRSGWEWGISQAHDLNLTSDRLSTVGKSSETPLSPDPNGTQILKTTIHRGDLAKDTRGGQVDKNASRAEVRHNVTFQNGDEVWYHWYTLFPSEIDLSIPLENYHVWTQFHQLNDSSFCPNPANLTEKIFCPAVPITFNIVDDDNDIPDRGPVLQLNVIEKDIVGSNSNNFKNLWNITMTNNPSLQRGEWYEFLLHVNWAKCITFTPTGTCDNHGGGFVELWVKEPNDSIAEKELPKTIHFTLDEDSNVVGDSRVYAKQGLYTCNPITNPGGCTTPNGLTQTIYHDGMEIAKCPSSHPYYHPNTKQCFNTEPYT